MDSKEWNSQKGSDKLKTLLRSAGLSLALAQASWSSLTKAEKMKIEKAAKGSKGWYEEKVPVVTEKGVEKKAPIHRQVAIEAALKDTERTPMVAPEPKKEEKPPEPRKEEKSPAQQTYLSGREEANALGTDVNEYTKVLYGVSKVLKNRGFNITPQELSNTFHMPLAMMSHSETIEQIIKAMEDTFRDGLIKGKDSYETTKAIDGTSNAYLIGRVYSAMSHDPITDVDGLIEEHLRKKFPDIRKNTNQWKEEYAKLTGKALKLSIENKKTSLKTALDELDKVRLKEGTEINLPAKREADHMDKQMGIIYTLNDKSDTIPEAATQIKTINNRIRAYIDSVQTVYQKGQAELKKLDEQQATVKEVQVVTEEKPAGIQNKPKYFITLLREHDDRSGYYNVRMPVSPAYPFTYKGIDCFAHKDINNNKRWQVTEITTGTAIPGIRDTQKEAIENAKEMIDKFTPEKLKDLMKKTISTQDAQGFKEYVEEVVPVQENWQKKKETVDQKIERIKTEAMKEAIEGIGKKDEPDPEFARFGEKVTVLPSDNLHLNPLYHGMIIRTLNNGDLIEVRPDGQTEGSFRVKASRVIPYDPKMTIKLSEKPRRYETAKEYIGIKYRTKGLYNVWQDQMEIKKFKGRPYSIAEWDAIIEYSPITWSQLKEQIQEEADANNRDVRDDSLNNCVMQANRWVSTPKTKEEEHAMSTDVNYSLKGALKLLVDKRNEYYKTPEGFRAARTSHLENISSDFHLKSHKDRAEEYKKGTIQYNKHMAEYKERLEEIAELKREIEEGKTIEELELEETMRQNDAYEAEHNKEQERRAQVEATDTDTLKSRAFDLNKTYSNESLPIKERMATKSDIKEIISILHERGIDTVPFINELNAQMKAG